MSTSKYKITFIRDSYIRFYNQHKKEIDKAISDCLAKGNVIMEQQVQEFEKKFAKFCEKKYCVTLRSGTDALLLAGRIRKPDLMQKYRYKLSFSAKSVEMKEGAINLMDLEDKVKKNDCLLITYMNSVQPNLKELEVIKKKYNLFIIEDACQSIGKKLIGDISCFSLYPAKMLGGMGKGGAIVSDNKEIIEKLRKIRDDKWNNLWLDEIKASFLNVKLKYLPQLLKKRQQVADRYNKELPKNIILSTQCLQNYIIVEKKYKELMQHLRDNGIEVFSDNNNFYEGNIKEGVRIPCYSELTDKEVKYIIKKIQQFYVR
ncbi:MAG: DegT/DnrJ/EryC1/StrS family aminotransferase [Nanoarchaeota archaeon]